MAVRSRSAGVWIGALTLAFASLVSYADFLDETPARLPESVRVSYSAAHGDVDGNGTIDMFLAAGDNSRLLINAAGTFTDESAARLPSTEALISDAVLVDMDLDGHRDLVITNADGPDALWLNDGAGIFNAAPAGALPEDEALSMAVATADLDRDGDPDLVIAVQDGPDRILINDGTGIFSDESTARLPLNAPSATLAVALADVDLDGTPDLLLTGNSGPSLYLNDGIGNFSPGILPGDLPASTGATFADVDRNGFPDLLLAAGESPLLLLVNDGSGGFTDESGGRLPALSGYALNVAAADVTEDGADDLIGAFADGLRLLVNDGSGTFSENTSALLPGDPEQRRVLGVSSFDLDKDIDADLVVATGGGDDRLLVNIFLSPRVRIAASPDYIETGDPVAISVEAFDEDGIDTLALAVEGPGGTTPVPLNGGGEGVFTPVTVGLYEAVATATDDDGSSTVRRLAFEALQPDATAPTVSVQVTPAAAFVGEPVAITLDASDAGTIVDRTLTVDGLPVPVDNAGIASYEPVLADAGRSLPVVATVVDAAGNSDTAAASLSVILDVTGPVVGVAVTPLIPALLEPVSIDASAVDAESPIRTLTVSVIPPSGVPVDVPLDADGNGDFIPTEPGFHQVDAEAFNASNTSGSDSAGFDAVGVPDVTPPTLVLNLDRTSVVTGSGVNIEVSASDDIGVTALELTVNGILQVLDAGGNVQFTPPIAGTYAVVARALDAFGNEATEAASLEALDAADDTNPPEVLITTPADGAEVGAQVLITGTATDETLTGYSLAVAPLGTSDFTTFAEGTLPVIDDELGSLDISTLSEGFYEVRLSAEDVNGATASTSVTVLFVDNLKLGRFTLEYEDVRLAAFGLPLAVQRSYDSASNEPGDFGLGWKLRLLDVELSTDGAANVFVTLPDGRRTAFAFTPAGVPFFPVFTSQYTPPSGVHATLAAPDCQSLIRSGSQWFCGLVDPFPPSTYELTLPDGVRYTIVDGEVTRLEDRSGNFLTLGADGLIASSGRSVVFERDGAGRITKAIDPNLGEFSYVYDALGRLERTEDQEHHVTRYLYDGSSNLILDVETADSLAELGTADGCRPLRQEYYTDGRIAAREDAAGNRTTYAYDDALRSETVTDPNNNPTTYFYDPLGRVLEVHDALGTITSYTYDAEGNEIAVVQPSGRVATNTYDDRGNRLSETHSPESGVTLTSTYTYNEFNQVTSFTAPLGDRTVYVYDGVGNQTRIERYDDLGALLETDQFTYDGQGNQLTWINARNKTTTYEYLPTGELERETDAGGATTGYEYDANGNRTAFIDGEGNRAEFEFNALNQPILMRQDGEVRWEATYDALGNITSITSANRDRNGDGNIDAADGPPSVTRYAYDCSGNLEMVTGPESETATYDHDGLTNLTRVTDPRTMVTTYDYDPALRPSGRTGPDGQTWGFDYDPDGFINRWESPESVIIHDYDGMSRLRLRTEPERAIEYVLDDNNRLLEVTEDDGANSFVTQYQYDELGNVLTVDAPGGVVSYTYNAGGQRATMTTPDTLTTTYTYDGGDRVETITTAGGGISDSVTFSYDSAGQRTGASYSNGVSTSYTYNGLGQLTSVTIRDSGDSIIASYDYTLDGNSQRTDIQVDDGTISYAYDDLYRLIGEEINRVSTGVQSGSWSYDAAGNRLDPSAVYGNDNRLQSDASGAYAYDLNGNVTGRVGDNFIYDSSNRLVAYNSAATTASYAYDYLGRRVLRTVGATTTEYLYDLGNVVAQIDGSGAVVARYTHGAGLDEVHIARVAGQSFFYHMDGLGSIVAITDASGNLVKRYAYDAWGNTLVDSGSLPFENPFRFVGREFDPESGLYHIRARAYDPVIGRFLQKDPLQGDLRVPQSLNLYAYARNNPANFVDPTGRVVTVEYAFILSFPNGREAAAALAGFLQGFGTTNIAFIGEFLAVVGNTNGLDIRAQWDLALARTKIRMDEVKSALGIAGQASDLAGVASIPGAFKSGVSFQLGFEINISIPFAGTTTGAKLEISGGGFENGVEQGLKYLRSLRPGP